MERKLSQELPPTASTSPSVSAGQTMLFIYCRSLFHWEACSQTICSAELLTEDSSKVTPAWLSQSSGSRGWPGLRVLYCLSASSYSFTTSCLVFTCACCVFRRSFNTDAFSILHRTQSQSPASCCPGLGRAQIWGLPHPDLK